MNRKNKSAIRRQKNESYSALTTVPKFFFLSFCPTIRQTLALTRQEGSEEGRGEGWRGQGLAGTAGTGWQMIDTLICSFCQLTRISSIIRSILINFDQFWSILSKLLCISSPLVAVMIVWHCQPFCYVHTVGRWYDTTFTTLTGYCEAIGE